MLVGVRIVALFIISHGRSLLFVDEVLSFHCRPRKADLISVCKKVHVIK